MTEIKIVRKIVLQFLKTPKSVRDNEWSSTLIKENDNFLVKLRLNIILYNKVSSLQF